MVSVPVRFTLTPLELILDWLLSGTLSRKRCYSSLEHNGIAQNGRSLPNRDPDGVIENNLVIVKWRVLFFSDRV